MTDNSNYNVADSSASYWVVRAKSGRLTPQFVRGGIAAVGWTELGDFRDLSLDALKKKMGATYSMNPQPGNVSSRVINSLRGILRQDGYGIVVTSSSFTKAAMKTTQRAGLKTIWLVDDNELCRLVLDNFDNLDEEIREKLRLKRVYRVE